MCTDNALHFAKYVSLGNSVLIITAFRLEKETWTFPVTVYTDKDEYAAGCSWATPLFPECLNRDAIGHGGTSRDKRLRDHRVFVGVSVV